ncbi:MAG: hypothetical protein R3174_14555 [Gammaproteobacteria bacterium]|nr:hypothetical protein [Gammaproteobacteria bacterium]
MMNSLDIRWKRLIIESAAIVASILLAFAIDAWWDNRNNRADERVVLQSLLDDLRNKLDYAERDRIRRQAIFDSAVSLLALALEQPSEIDEQQVSRLLTDILWTDCWECWISAPLNTVVSGSTAATISSASLIQELSDLHVSLARIQGERARSIEFHFAALSPFLLEHADFAHLAAITTHQPGTPEVRYDFPIKQIANKADYADLLADTEFQGLLSIRIDQHGEFFREGFMEIEDLLERVIVMLEEEIRDL